MQAQVLAYVESWAERFALADAVRLDSPVYRARHAESCWELDTPAGTIRARHLVAATGAHNRPRIAPVVRRHSTVREFHSSALRDPSILKDRYVMAVGRGRVSVRPARAFARAGHSADRLGVPRCALADPHCKNLTSALFATWTAIGEGRPKHFAQLGRKMFTYGSASTPRTRAAVRIRQGSMRRRLTLRSC
jgi:glycine/D-amino acid oxidase-like deaminating enzyme